MKELKCPNCGAPINRATMKCEYGGAGYKWVVDDDDYCSCAERKK